MRSKLQICIPMAGLGSRFLERGYTTPKYMLPCDQEHTPMIELAVKTININEPCKYFFVLNRSQPNINQIANVLEEICVRYNWDYEIGWVESLTEGAASTVWSIRNLLDPNAELIVSNSDQILENFHCTKFLEKARTFDGAVVTYNPSYELVYGAADKHSFLGLDKITGTVIKVDEKIVLSEHALIGTHWFSSAQIFCNAYQYMIEKNMRVNNEYYVSLCYQAMLEQNLTVGYYELSGEEKYWSTGTPIDYNLYRAEHKEEHVTIDPVK